MSEQKLYNKSIEQPKTMKYHLTISTDIDIDIFGKGFIRPVFASKEHEFRGGRFGPPNIAEFRLQPRQGNSLAEIFMRKEFDEWHGRSNGQEKRKGPVSRMREGDFCMSCRMLCHSGRHQHLNIALFEGDNSNIMKSHKYKSYRSR